ncbi:uncharacterized protein [Spinacia oleracea]|uniref:Uncharacterized protein isoform X2 n=1 Tax=Spinacia oleracea TaxID=3562 RepID=A0ABM3QW43_SPIOL|nr:uncharacterized protein LOC110795258 isoform X2 [Spinacia oleracea]
MRKSDIKMEVALMFVGIIVFLSMTTLSAQEGFPGECWERIENCTSSLTPGEIQEQCCPVITQEISDERECFCGVKPLVLQNVTIADTLSDLLTLCSVASSFDTLCPVKFEEAPCWIEINDCIGNNVNVSESEPQFDPSSPMFNATELLCCPLIQKAARIEKQCFCSVNTFIEKNPTLAKNTTDILSICSIADSAASLIDLCVVEGPSPSPAPTPLLRTEESLKAASPSTEESKTTAEASSTNKITITGSLCILLVLLTNVLYY